MSNRPQWMQKAAAEAYSEAAVMCGAYRPGPEIVAKMLDIIADCYAKSDEAKKLDARDAEIERLRAIADAAWLMRTEEKDYTPAPDLVLRAHWRKRLYGLLDEWKNSDSTKAAAEAARKGAT